MKKFLLILLIPALAFALSWHFAPHFLGDPAALAAAQRDRASLAFFTPQIRTYLLRDDAATRAVLDDCIAADTAIAAAREILHSRTAADSDFEKLKTNYLKAGMAKLELVKKVTESYEKFAATNPDFARASIENDSAFGGLENFPLRLPVSLLAALIGGVLALGIAARAPSTPEETAGLASADIPATSPRLEQRKLVLPKNGVIELLPVPPGSFEKRNGERRENIAIAHPFWLGKYEVTQEQWEAVMGAGNNPSQNKGPKLPVENITWDEANEFCKRVNTLPPANPLANYHYALPSEDQWEYAAIVGGDEGWTAENADGKTHNVGEKAPNKWGFYDMRGNVAEMCLDMFVGFETVREGASLHFLGSGIKVAKGAAINDKSISDNTVVRRAINKNERSGERGFRLALVPTK